MKWLLWFAIAMLCALGGCLAPDGSVIGVQSAQDGPIAGLQANVSPLTAAETSTPAPALPTHTPQPEAIGKEAMTNFLRWRVHSLEELGSELVSEDPSVEIATTTGRFVRVGMEIENLGGAAVPFFYFAPELLDSQGRNYSNFAGRFPYIPNGQGCLSETLYPGHPLYCTAIFEVASDATGYQLLVTYVGILFTIEATIDLR